MSTTASLIATELDRKAELVGLIVLAIAMSDADGSVSFTKQFADEFTAGNLEEAQHEIEARIKMLEQSNVPVEVKATREPKVIDAAQRHADTLAKLPAELAAIADNGKQMVRLFKKTGKTNVAIVITYADASKRTFRAPTGTNDFTESVAPVVEEPEATTTIGPVAAEALES